MKKVYFAPNWGLTSEQMVQDYIKQSPNNSGVWSNITYTTNPDEADFLIIQDNADSMLINKFSPSQRLYFSREAMTPQMHLDYLPSLFKRSSFWDGTGICWVKWRYDNGATSAGYSGINLTYDELVAEKHPPIKNNKLSCIQSDKRMTQGHVLRHNFLGVFASKAGSRIDLYGGIRYANKKMKDNNKLLALDSYKYNLAFDNQGVVKDFFGTQFTDALLRWCLPIYWGGANLSKYFPEGSFKKVDITKGEYAIKEIIDFSNSGAYEENIEQIREARHLLLNKYNMWPLLKEVIEAQENKIENKAI